MRGKDASNRGKATGKTQLARRKDKRAAQHECQRNHSIGYDDIGNNDRADNNDDKN
jgi:hypothetical protein